MAMGVGLTCVRSDSDAGSDSFGLVVLSSVGPVLAVMLLGLFFKPQQANYIASDIANVITTRDVVYTLLMELPKYMGEVLLSIFPLLLVFIVVQCTSRHIYKKQVKQMLVGFLYTYLGLVLFLCGVNIGFSPVGAFLGQELASSRLKWLLVPIGMLIGYYLVKAEPAIQILNRQVQDVTNWFGVSATRIIERPLEKIQRPFEYVNFLMIFLFQLLEKTLAAGNNIIPGCFKIPCIPGISYITRMVCEIH
ncbi:DUF1538 domain-containing protein [bacterium 1XD42-1]|nr:DUF1538 domain-containing protein [bacterium 1XD42-8]RKJ65422.1 DUF1538 domain-containing protein [bacterium 1XD42-1]